jgi:hypothetical protein
MSKHQVDREEVNYQHGRIRHALKKFNGEITGWARTDRRGDLEAVIDFQPRGLRMVGPVDDAISAIGTATSPEEVESLLSQTGGFEILIGSS